MGTVAALNQGHLFEVSNFEAENLQESSVEEFTATAAGSGVCLVAVSIENKRSAGAYGSAEIHIFKNESEAAAVNNGVPPSSAHSGTEPAGCATTVALELSPGDVVRVRGYCNAYNASVQPAGTFKFRVSALSSGGKLEFIRK